VLWSVRRERRRDVIRMSGREGVKEGEGGVERERESEREREIEARSSTFQEVYLYKFVSTYPWMHVCMCVR
jgi:hypothetical protein